MEAGWLGVVDLRWGMRLIGGGIFVRNGDEHENGSAAGKHSENPPIADVRYQTPTQAPSLSIESRSMLATSISHTSFS